MPVTKDEFLKYLSDTISHETPYHNHKETTAWAAIVLYFLLITKVVESLHSWPIPATVIIVGALIAVSCVIRIQYQLRRDAANVIGACYKLIAEYLPKVDVDLKDGDLAVPKLGDCFFSCKCNYRPTGHYPYILPKVLLKTMCEMNTVGHRPRSGLDLISYLLVFGGTFFSFVIIWYPVIIMMLSKLK